MQHTTFFLERGPLMKCVWSVALVFGSILLTAGSTQTTHAGDKVESLVGTWVCVKSEERPAGVKLTVEFAKDGKCKITAESNAATLTLKARYKVDGDKLTVDLDEKRGDFDQHFDYVITKLTKRTVVWRNRKTNREDELIRKED